MIQVSQLPVFRAVAATAAETAAPLAGDQIVARADVVMDRGFTVAASPEVLWPWLIQLGKGRAGWYLPRSVERFLRQNRRATRQIDARWQALKVGDVVPDYGGPNETFTVAILRAPTTLVYQSWRGQLNLTWAITLTALPDAGQHSTRVHLRLRLGPVVHRRLAETVGELFDVLTVQAMAAGLRERLAERA